jgi:hypothetical protein
MTLAVNCSQLCLYSAVAGIISHWTYFKHGEHHIAAPKLLRLSLAVPVILFAGFWHYGNLTPVQSAVLTAGIITTYSASLWSSIVIYRVYFHRLGSFPGPFGAKVSKLWHVWKLAPKSDNYLLLDEMHRKYGDFVRTGT